MTRLISDQIRTIPEKLETYDEELKTKTGLKLGELAAQAAGIIAKQIEPQRVTVAVIPVTAGLGTIEGFSEAIRAIAIHLGFRAFITASTDVGGLAEAYESGADLAILADDYVYVAINLNTRRVAGNDEATALGYTMALAKMAGGLNGKEVLLIGAGPVGSKAAGALIETGAKLIVLDLDKQREAGLAEVIEKKYGRRVAFGLELEEALQRKPLIFDASTGEGFITASMISENTIVAAPGLPSGLTSEAQKKVAARLVHDPLQIGTAVMLFKALA